MENNFDIILFSPGDVVIRKNKEPDVYGNRGSPLTVDRVENSGSGKLIFQILYFTDGSFDLANNYEPHDPEQLEEYNKIMKQVLTDSRVSKKSKKPAKKAPEVLTFDMSKIKKDGKKTDEPKNSL